MNKLYSSLIINYIFVDVYFRIYITLFLFVVIFNILNIDRVYAWTYDDSSTFLKNEQGVYGILRITFTYPTHIKAGESTDIGINIQYIPNPGSQADWVILNNITISLYNLTNEKIVENIKVDSKSTILK